MGFLFEKERELLEFKFSSFSSCRKEEKKQKKSKKNYSLSMSLAASPPIDTSVAVFAAMCQNEE